MIVYKLHLSFEYQYSEIKLLIIVLKIFRHGQRTPDNSSYPTDPYVNETFYPEGRGQLTLVSGN